MYFANIQICNCDSQDSESADTDKFLDDHEIFYMMFLNGNSYHRTNETETHRERRFETASQMTVLDFMTHKQYQG